MSRAEYKIIHSKYFSTDIIDQYQIDGLIAAYGYVYIKIIKGMYGLKQVSIISYNELLSHMEPHGYYSVPFKTGLWVHNTRKKCLCVNDFGVKYLTKDDANHLLDYLKNHYAISIVWEEHSYHGLAIDWKYIKEYVYISMTSYVNKALVRLLHPIPKRPQLSPHLCTVPSYWKRLGVIKVEQWAEWIE